MKRFPLMCAVSTAACALLALAAPAAHAQSSSVTLYGDIDEYLNYMSSSSGTKLKTLSDGANLRSRIGFKGTEVVSGDLSVKFTLESGLSSDSGSSADTTRFFDRQAWVCLASPTAGEVRLGRQNTAIFTRGGNVDFTARTLGSIVNNFGVPARLDNDIAWISPVFSGLQAEAHYAPGESTVSNGSLAVYQYAVDYTAGPFKANWAGLRAHPSAAATVKKIVGYDNVNVVYDYGDGKVYGAFVRSNNITSSANGNTAANLLGGTGALLSTSMNAADASRFYNIWQLSGDYCVTPQLRVGALWGKVIDTSHSGRNATGGAIGAYYDLSKRTTFYGLAETMSNDSNAGFRPAGSAAVSPNFTGSDVNGQKVSGAQLGVVHRF
jgi:predicted porin